MFSIIQLVIFNAVTKLELPKYNKYWPLIPLSVFPITLLEITVLEIVKVPLFSIRDIIGPLAPVIRELVKVTVATPYT